ncbi:hypothetical protein RB595_007549 [Gaeumannomyces hyphopodioides]
MDPNVNVQAARVPAESPLCKSCRKGLEFDDKAAGGFNAVSEDGETLEYLLMPDMHKYRRGDSSGYDSWYHPPVKTKEPLPVSQHLCKDFGPDFPALASSARGPQGCSFCRVIRARLLSMVAEKSPPLSAIISRGSGNAISIDFSSYTWAGHGLGFEDVDSQFRGDLRLYVLISPAGVVEVAAEGGTSVAKAPLPSSKPPTSEEILPIESIALIFRLDPYAGDRGAESVRRWLRLRPLFSGPNRFNTEAALWAKSHVGKAPVELTAEETTWPMLYDLRKRKPTTFHVLEGEFCPKRLVDVRSDPPRLVLGKDIPSNSPAYAALSYCWGSEEDAKAQLKTTKDSLLDRMRAIHSHEMTAALRDAIAVTRALDIPYLWIDALCILQGEDSSQDWEEQSGSLHLIYGYARVTIGALAPDSCRKSFLDPPPDEADVYLRWSSTLSPGVSGLFSVAYSTFKLVSDLNKPLLQPASIVSFVDHENSISPWYTRGWTFAEGAVSQRFLAFTRSALVFCNPEQAWLFGVEKSLQRWRNSLPINTDFDWQSPTWLVTARSYSDRTGGFARPTDFLPAISGLAAFYAKHAGYTAQDYLAGLWGPDLLHYMLTWITNKPRRTDLPTLVRDLTSQEPYVCPSWSWGIQREVGWPLSGRTRSMCRMWVVGLRPKGTNPFGEVAPGGRLRITGRVVPLPSDLRFVRDHTVKYKDEYYWYSKTGGESDSKGDWRWAFDWRPDEEKVLPRGDLKMVLTGYRPSTDGIGPMVGLIIHPVEGPGPGACYVRVGSFCRMPISGLIPWADHLPLPYFGNQRQRTIDII